MSGIVSRGQWQFIPGDYGSGGKNALYCEGTISDVKGNSVTIKGSDGTVYIEGTGNCNTY
ncbi:hypothetical protein [Blautia pseudococcoides]|uniref:Uncharacterized protein n=1 Tax=Blautia pseudococcoides TaxID=1796616 RepID=A0A1C7IAJ4_9FIRM|nr:hypothetical protein [Blautia pseudococcoides]ANU75934.1 hypothetical protein A4V09_09255 [Blautia pseudococcoides]ASU28746.1 hypothetical protein ADH70_007675 [Blautia pseudococcoides]QJU13898.1 hypothetical protein HL650_05135 [Blautia pseudococcoides]QQQ93507.1 hypothetical protein I5Q86_01465 [Blautia pseudococcoides]